MLQAATSANLTTQLHNAITNFFGNAAVLTDTLLNINDFESKMRWEIDKPWISFEWDRIKHEKHIYLIELSKLLSVKY